MVEEELQRKEKEKMEEEKQKKLIEESRRRCVSRYIFSSKKQTLQTSSMQDSPLTSPFPSLLFPHQTTSHPCQVQAKKDRGRG